MKKKTRVDTDQTLVFMKRFSDRVVTWLVPTPITPDHITLGSFLITAPLVSYLLITGGYVNNLLALGILIVHSFLDLMDGELARRRKISSRLGVWFERSLDPMIQMIVLMSVSLHILLFTDEWWKYLVFFAIFGQSFANILGEVLSNKFKIDPLTGNAVFNEKAFMSKKPLDFILKNIMVPSHPLFVAFLTMRFYLIVGIFLNALQITFILFSFAIVIRAFVVYLILCLHYTQNTSLYKYAVFKHLHETE